MKYIQAATLLLFALIFFCFSSAAQAQNNTSSAETGDMFKDWNTMRNYMLSQGLDPQHVNWTDIDVLCAGMKSSSDQRPYNKCAYTKGRDLLLFTASKTQCLNQAHGAYPDSLLQQRTDTLTEKDEHGVSHTFSRVSTPPSTRQSLDQQRAGAFADCMQKLGWVDANDWQPGKRNEYCQ